MSATVSSVPANVGPGTEPGYFETRFLRNAWYVGMWAAELREGELVERTILGESIVFFRSANGAISALTNRCPHRFSPLHPGKLLDGERIQCPYHGLEFDGAGHCVRNPHGNGIIPNQMKVRSFTAIEKHTCIWVWMGDRSPDLSSVPDFSVIDNAAPGHLTKHDRITVQAHYQLVADNLLDTSHGAYLHAGLLATVENTNAEITVESTDNTVTVNRLARSVPLVGLHREYWPHSTFTVDQYTSVRWSPPSYILLTQGATLPGESSDTKVGYYGIHLLTPETDRTTTYHFTAVRINVSTPASRDAEINAKIEKGRRFAFAEQDAPMIEAQQRVLDAAGGKLQPTLIAVDAGPARCKRIIEKLLAAD
jgi:phenylpropionate dioxygenase-like ring-hydroxylating dioxygenase large terminal subunit